MVKLNYHSIDTSSRFSNESSTSNTINPGRIFQIPLVINMPYHTNSYRKSTFDIPITSFQNADYTTNIPKPLQSNTNQPSPLTSPTFSLVTENIKHKLNVLETDFVVNKKYFIDDFYSNHNAEKRSWFFKTFMKERQEIQICFYNFITLHRSSNFVF